MPKMKFNGPITLRLRSFLTINRIAMGTYFRHLFGRRMAPDWGVNFEIGIRFWRHQHTAAMTHSDIAEGRLLYDSLVTQTDDTYDVATEVTDCPQGVWYHPRGMKTDTIILHFHGGGYTFHGEISKRYAAMLAHHCGASVFAPDYRLTPEHPHPAQFEDALDAWRYVLQRTPAERVVVMGDSAGGHMALMLLQSLKTAGLAQPALCVGLCPWTDIGPRGASLAINDRYDLVQGWMAVRFGEWLDPDLRFGRETLSPIYQDFSNVAPIYIQVGGRDVLRDMVLEFADVQKANSVDICVDLWPDMPHNFQAYDSLTQSSTEALRKLANIVQHRKIEADKT